MSSASRFWCIFHIKNVLWENWRKNWIFHNLQYPNSWQG